MKWDRKDTSSPKSDLMNTHLSQLPVSGSGVVVVALGSQDKWVAPVHLPCSKSCTQPPVSAHVMLADAGIG